MERGVQFFDGEDRGCWGDVRTVAGFLFGATGAGGASVGFWAVIWNIAAMRGQMAAPVEVFVFTFFTLIMVVEGFLFAISFFL